MNDSDSKDEALRKLIRAAEFVMSESRHAPDAKSVARFRRALQQLEVAINDAKAASAG
jgi:hypothetical protein